MHGAFLAIAMGVLCLTFVGCTDGGVETVPVSGKVTLDGEPVGDVMVNFQPTGGTTGPGSAGLTSADGTYSLKTVGETTQEGAVVGTHTVTLIYKDPNEDTSVDFEPEAAEPAVTLPPEAYDQSLTFEVPPGGTDSANFDLESAE